MIGSVHNVREAQQVKAATKSVEIATNGGVAYKAISRSELGIPADAEILMTNVYPKHKANQDDIWTAVFFGYSWDPATDKVEIAVNGRLTGLQRQMFEVNVLYYG